MVAMMNAEDSWVARWQRIPGLNSCNINRSIYNRSSQNTSQNTPQNTFTKARNARNTKSLHPFLTVSHTLSVFLSLSFLLTSAHFKHGCYALSVNGRLPGEIVKNLERSGIKYQPRHPT
eukprot:TRINITY_DN680_c0_g1_i4.p1 TRINITY_DN680_c0_g1~~TRINITY_DN680_c0_g1_i4.p1  ORF type:complete len:119 (-),score=18.90 TRINITY_DN680_c0_g1_i4:198-554(-)